MTKQACIYLLLFLLLGGASAGCFGCFGSDDDSSQTAAEDDDEDEDDSAEDLADAGRQVQDALKGVLGGGDVEGAVDFRDLRDVLPGEDDISGMSRVDSKGERTKFMGMEISTAEVVFEGEGRLTFSAIDLGTLTELARLGYAAWLRTELDRENDRGFERTGKTRIGGKEYPYYEKFQSSDGDRGSCEIQLWVAERFIVKVEGRNVEMDQCEDGRDEINFRKLDSMKDERTSDD